VETLTRRPGSGEPAVDLERLLPWGRPPRLLLRFALYTGLGITLAAGAILLFVRHFERSRAERAATTHTRLVAEVVSDELLPSDLQGPVSLRRRDQLDVLVARRVLRDGVVRVDLIGSRSTITYSSDHAFIGQRETDRSHVREAIGGTTVSEVTSIDPPGPHESLDVLRAFAAIRVPGAATGALALSQDHAPIVQAAHRAVLPVVSVLELVLLGLYISLFPILRRVTKDMRRQMEVIEHQALHDALTGLPNRTFFQAIIDESVAADEAGFAVLIVELDRFKDINDTLGHAHGDTLLCEIARRIDRAAVDCDAVARLDGDEFGVLSRRGGDERSAVALADRLAEAIAEPVEVAGVSLEPQSSIGIALWPEHGGDAATLLRRADVAMHAAKSLDAPQLYSTEGDTHSPARLALASELRTGLDSGELVVYYQPQVDLQTSAVNGVEALVRWRHPRRGFLTPDEFLSTAEHAGLMRRLTGSVLQQALAQARTWRNNGLELSVAVNVSGRDLVDSRFVDEVGKALAEHGTDPESLHLEITEGTLLHDRSRAESVLGRLSELGVRIAVDDFGTGYSSLGHLKRLPVDILKIDKSFIISMASEPGDAAIVRSTIDLAHSLDLTVVAEGVETREAQLQLEALGCDVAQGFGISRPLPAQDLDEWLAANTGRFDAVPQPTPLRRRPAAPLQARTAYRATGSGP
jgi:diguanylate cyclase (GGDEF)-like protein